MAQSGNAINMIVLLALAESLLRQAINQENHCTKVGQYSAIK